MSLLREGENMNESDAQTIPNYVTYHCHHCGGGIEFDASDFAKDENRWAECPHCHKSVLIYVDRLTPKQFSDY
jgi:DNA-directed RNA polymerase subunit RPC12/RpoP